MEVKYGLLLKKSWNDLTNNLIVFLPMLMALLFCLGFLVVIGLEFLVFLAFGVSFKDTNISSWLIVLGLVFLIIDLFLALLVNGAVKGMMINLFNLVSTNKTASTKDMWNGMKKFTFILLRYNLFILLGIFIPLLILGLISGLVFLASKTAGMVLFVVLGTIYLLYLFAFIVIFSFGLMFFGPMLSASKSNSALELIKSCLKYSKENLEHVIITWFIVFAIGILLYLPRFFASFIPNLYLRYPILFLFYIISFAAGMWLSLFVFNAYFNKNLKK